MFGQLLMHSCGRGGVGISLLYFQTVDPSAPSAGREWQANKPENPITLNRFLQIVHQRMQKGLKWKEGKRDKPGGRGVGCRMELSEHIREKNRLRTSKLHRQAECQQLVISGSRLRQ